MATFKGYVYAIVSGIMLLAAVIFLVLQWGSTTHYFFWPARQASTFWFTLAAAVGGAVAYRMARLFLQGMGILWRARRERKRILSQVRRAEQQAEKNKP
jgi:hypothetical protein